MQGGLGHIQQLGDGGHGIQPVVCHGDVPLSGYSAARSPGSGKSSREPYTSSHPQARRHAGFKPRPHPRVAARQVSRRVAQGRDISPISFVRVLQWPSALAHTLCDDTPDAHSFVFFRPQKQPQLPSPFLPSIAGVRGDHPCQPGVRSRPPEASLPSTPGRRGIFPSCSRRLVTIARTKFDECPPNLHPSVT